MLTAYAVSYYAGQGLTLSHYDAKAHLVVARRILDSMTPGWEQVGAVWLPLPHLVNMLPVQIDALYRSGASAIALSVVCGGIASAALAATVLELTGSRAGAVASSTLYATNPNVLYLQSTPMTEPLLFALTALQVLLTVRWVKGPAPEVPRALGWVTVLACLTRYEAWPVTAALFVLSAAVWLRRGVSRRVLVPVYLRWATYPLAAIFGFMVFSRITVGEWFVSGGFFVPDPELQGDVRVVWQRMNEGMVQLGGITFTRASLAAIVLVVVVACWQRARTASILSIALVAAAALPLLAYLSGHPFRIRYQVPLVLAGSLVLGVGTGLLGRAAPAAALVLVILVGSEVPPFDPRAPILEEARVDVPQREGRRQVTACLSREYRGETIMASMGALAPYMQELSAAGLGIADFLHEGNGPIWDSAFTRGPAPLAGWVLVEEYAEGGDALYQRARQYPRFLEGFNRVCEGGNVALYKRQF